MSRACKLQEQSTHEEASTKALTTNKVHTKNLSFAVTYRNISFMKTFIFQEVFEFEFQCLVSYCYGDRYLLVEELMILGPL